MNKKNLVYIFIIIITISQCFILIKLENKEINKEVTSNEDYSITKRENAKYIKEIIKDLENNDTLTILSYNKLENNNWKLKCILEGNKEDVLKDIDKLNYYDIMSYSLSYENKRVLLELELISK